MKRASQPILSVDGERALDQYTSFLRQMEDLTAVTIRNYVSDLRQFMAWCQQCWQEEREHFAFTPQAVATPLLMRYRSYLQTTLDLTPATVNRALMSLKRYFNWAVAHYMLVEDPMRKAKLVPKETPSPRHLSDDEETALVSAVNAVGNMRDKTIIILLLHTGLRAQELCTFTCKQVHIGKHSGTVRILGKRNKVRRIALNSTARTVLQAYLATLPKECIYLFPSEKTRQALTERALGHLIKKYAGAANLADVSPHVTVFSPWFDIDLLLYNTIRIFFSLITSLPLTSISARAILFQSKVGTLSRIQAAHWMELIGQNRQKSPSRATHSIYLSYLPIPTFCSYPT